MTPVLPAAPAQTHAPTTGLPGTLAFRGLWLFSARADVLLFALPLLLALSVAASSLMSVPASDAAHRLAGWTAQNLLGGPGTDASSGGSTSTTPNNGFAVPAACATAAGGEPRQ